MAYTNAWDETQPPDSQLANQLGQDIRSLKTDIHERMFLVGTLSQRPTPEAAFAGMMFFATDTKLFYRWTGSQWFAMTVMQTYADLNVHTGSNGAFTLSTLDIGAGKVQVGSKIRFAYSGQITTGSGQCSMALFVGAIGGTLMSGGGPIWTGNIVAGVGHGELTLVDTLNWNGLMFSFTDPGDGVACGSMNGPTNLSMITNGLRLRLAATAAAGTVLTSNYFTADVIY